MEPWWRAADTGDRTAWAETDLVLRDRAGFDQGYRSPILADVAADPTRWALPRSCWADRASAVPTSGRS